MQGCCSFGAHFIDADDVKTVKKSSKRLTAKNWQFKEKADEKGWHKTDKSGTVTTKTVDGACIFLNRPGFEGGVGCALHIGATEAGDTDGVGQGGDGLASSITGSSITRAGGGGAGSYAGSGGGLGGDGGGGKGATSTVNAVAGSANTGGGGGGANYSPNTLSAAGGSGVVILRYPTGYTISNPGGGLTYTTASAGSDTVTTFTAGTGNIQFN